MKKLVFLIFFNVWVVGLAQESKEQSVIDVNYFRGNISLHNNGILHLIKGHPEGVIIGWNKKTFGEESWQERYGFPDYGASFIYQNLKNETLGNNYGVYAHYNFYFLKRMFMFRVGQGIALTTNPYHKIDNHKNIAFGSKLLSSTYLMFNFKKERIFGNFGLQAGVSLIHYSNANVKAPNTSINVVTLNAGVTYNLEEVDNVYQSTDNSENFTEPIKYNVVFRTGINESDIIGSGQFPFYVFSGYADKRLSYKSSIQFGTDVFFSKFLKEFIKYESVAFPDRNIDENTDYKRVGLFAGHELFINKMSVETQAGYYVYYPYDFEDRVYFRVGLKRYFGKKWFGTASVKSHGTAAEAVEFGVGIRL